MSLVVTLSIEIFIFKLIQNVNYTIDGILNNWPFMYTFSTQKQQQTLIDFIILLISV